MGVLGGHQRVFPLLRANQRSGRKSVHDQNCVKYYSERFSFCSFFSKVKNNRDIKGVQIYGTKVQTQKWLSGFQQNLASAIYPQRSKLCTTLNLKIFKGGKVLESIFFCSNYWLQRKSVHGQNCVKYYFERFPLYSFFCKVKIDRDTKGVQIYETSLNLKKWLNEFQRNFGISNTEWKGSKCHYCN